MTTAIEPKPNTDSLTKGVVPYFHVEGAAGAIDFYTRAFGAREVSRFAGENGKLMNAQLEINGGLIMIMDAMPEHGFAALQPSHSYSMQLMVPDGRGWFDRAVAAGCTVRTPFQKMFWGDLWGQVVDRPLRRGLGHRPAGGS